MGWSTLDDSFHEHPRFASYDLDTLGLLACAMTYCNRHRTDGHIPTEQLARFGTSRKGRKLADKLVADGYWERTATGYYWPGFLDRNLSREDAEAKKADISARRAEAGRLGGLARAAVASKQTQANVQANPSKPNPSNEANVKPYSYSYSQGEERESAPEQASQANLASKQPEQVSKQASPVAPDSGTYTVAGMATPCPDSLPDATLRELEANAVMAGWPAPRDEWEAFRDYRRGQGKLTVDWVADFRGWLRRGKTFAASDRNRRSGSRGPAQPIPPQGICWQPGTVLRAEDFPDDDAASAAGGA